MSHFMVDHLKVVLKSEKDFFPVLIKVIYILCFVVVLFDLIIIICVNFAGVNLLFCCKYSIRLRTKTCIPNVFLKPISNIRWRS